RCAPGPYRYIVRTNDLGHQTCETNLPNVFCCSPAAANSVYAVATASGVDHTGPGGIDCTPGSGGLDSSFSDCRNIPITIFLPQIQCFKSCTNSKHWIWGRKIVMGILRQSEKEESKPPDPGVQSIP